MIASVGSAIPMAAIVTIAGYALGAPPSPHVTSRTPAQASLE
jgi:hypothetical protein